MTGGELRAMRESLGLSRAALSAALAREAGVTVAPHTLYYWETGRRYGAAGTGGIPSGVAEWVRDRLVALGVELAPSG